MKKVISTTLVGALILTAPGPRAWAVVAGAVGRAASAPAGTGSAAGAASVSALSGTGKFSSLQARPQGGLGTSLPVAPALIPQASIVLSARPAAGPASMIAPAAGLYARPGLEGKIAPAAPGKARVFSNLEAMNAPVAAAGERRSKSERQAGISAHDLFDKLLGWKARSSGAGISPVSGRVVPGLRPLLGAAAKKKPVRPAPAAVSAWESFEGPPMDLGLRSEELEKVAEFTSDFHDKIVAGHYEYGFTVRDYYAWARFVRFFTPSLGVQEAVKRGAVYVYADRLETPAERDQFKKDLDAALGNLKLADPKHGFDEEKAEKLLKIAEPDPEALAEDEESPYQFPLHELVPKKENADLVGTPTTLERIDAAYNAFALRDYMLMVGPPATVKSAIPKFLASEYKIPHLAVTLHPGIGTFELVGGYQPKEVKIATASDAKRIVRRALQEAKSGDDFTDILESAAKVYGSNGMAAVLKNIEADLSSEGPGREESRRLVTLAHGIRYGSASLAWQDGYLTFALKRDIWITLEEINAAPTEVVEFLNEFLRSRKLVITEKLGEPETLRPKANGRFMLWATMNHETDSNRQVMADTLKNRWRMKSFGPLPPLEQAEILEEKFGLPQTWALALVENVHNELRRQAVERVIGADWRDGYEINLRHLFKIAKRWKRFVDREEADSGKALDDARKLFLLGRETYAIYGGMMRLDNERSGVFTMIDQAFKLSAAGVSKEEDLVVRPDRIEDLGDAIRIGDVVLKKGKGGPFVPEPNADYLVDENVLARLYQYAKAIALGEPVLLMGETAAGKTSDLEYLYYRLNKNLRYRNLHSDSAIEEVVGGYTTGKKRGKYLFKEGMLPAGMEEGTGVFLDEFNLNPLVEWLNTVVDDNRLFLPHRIVEGKADLVAAANPPEPRYEGRVLLSPAVRSRWTEIWVPADNSKGRLKKLMGHWLKGGAVYALLPLLTAGLIFGPDGALPFLFMGTLAAAGKASDMSLRSLWSGLKGLWPFKKKSDNPGDEDLALPGSLEEVLKNKKIPEADWPKLRAKVERIQTVMKMVGSSVGRDTTLKWVPGYMWAIFPGENTATYPLEHLVTHTPEEVVGLVDHEALHREVTVLDERFPLVRKYLSDPVKHFLWNGLEDPRVNSRGIHRLPGAERYLHAAYDRYIPEELDPAVMREWQAMPHEGLDIPEGDGASLFHPAALRYPHIEFVMAANYYWRFGKKPKAFMNKSAEEAFDKGLPDMKEVFESYPRGQRPEEREKLALSISALKIIDEKLLPLYEPLVQESQKKLAQNKKKGKSKGKKGEGQGKNGKSGGPSPMPPDQKSQKPKPQEQDESGKPGKKELEQALRDLKDHAKKAAENLGGHLKKNPTRKDAGLNGRGPAEKATPGDGKPGALTISEIARNQRQARMAEENSPFRRVHRRVAPFVNSMVSRFENIFYENSRPMDVGYFRRGKKPDIQRAMRREGEGGVKQDIWLRRVHNTKRSYKVSILIDESGSMQGRLREVLDAVTLMMEGLGRLRIDLEIIGFDKVARIHKKFGEAMTKENKERIIAEIEEYFAAGPATHDADAIRLALDRIQAEETDKRLIFVITDGAGNGPSKLADILPDADKAGVYVMGVGIGAGMAYVQEVYPHRALVEDIRDLPATLYKELHEYIQKVERTSSARSAGTVFNFAAVPRGRAGRNGAVPTPTKAAQALGDWFRIMTLSNYFTLAAVAAAITTIFLIAPGITAGLAGTSMLKVLLPVAGAIFLAHLMFGNTASALAGFGGFLLLVGGIVPVWLLPVVVPFFTAVAYDAVSRELVKRTGALPGKLRAALSRELPGKSAVIWARSIERTVVNKALLGSKDARIATLVKMRTMPTEAAYVPALEWIVKNDPEYRARELALEVLFDWTRFQPAAFDALERLEADPSLPAALKEGLEADLAALRERIGQATEVEELAVPRAGTATEALLKRALGILSSLKGDSLKIRARREAVERSIARLEEAAASGEADAIGIAAGRLEKQLSKAVSIGALFAGRAALAPGANGVSPVSRVKGFFGGLGLRHLLAWTVWAGYAFLVFQLPPLAVMGVSALAGFAVMALSWRWRDGSIYPLLLFMSGMLPLSSGMSLSMDYGAWTAAAGAAMIALALPAAYSHRYQPLSLPARLELRRVRKANGLEGMGKIVDWLSGTGPQRYGVIVALEKNGGAVARIVPLLEVIARRDPSERIRDGALGLIVKNAVETKKAYDALGKIAASKAPTAPYAARALVKIDEILRRKGDEALEALAAREEADAAAVRAGLIERANAVLRKLSDRTLSGRQRRAAIETAVKYLEAALEGGDADGVKIAAKRLGDQLDAAKERGFGFFAGGTRVAGRSPAAPNAPSLADRSALRRLGDFLTSDKFIHGWLQASWIVPLLSAYWIGEAAILLFGASLFPALLYLIAMIFIRAKKKTYGYPVENLVAQAGAVYFGMPRKDREELKRVLEGVPALYKKKSGLRVKANHPGLYLIYSMVEVRDLAWEQSFEILKRSAYRRAAATLLADIIWDAADAAWSVGGAGLGLLVSQRDYERLAALGEPGRDKLFGLLEADFGPEPERWAGDALADNLLSWSWTREQVERLTALRPDLAARLEEAAPLEAVAGSLAKAAELEGGLGEFLAKARSAARSLKTPAASMINKRRAADIEKRVAAVEGAADEASRALAVERLKEALRRLPGDGGRAFFNAAAGPLNGAVAAAGSGRTLRRLKRFLTRPDMITLLLIPSIEALLFGGMYLFGATIVPLVKPWILFTLIATGIAAFGKGRSMKTQRIGGVLFLLTLSTFLALGAFNAAGDPGGWVVAVMGWSAISFLLTYVMVSAIRRARMGFLHPRARYSIDQAGKKAKLDARGRELLSMLKAHRTVRLEALQEMLADPEAARGLRPVVDSMLFNDKDPAAVSYLIELYARWGDMDARMMLKLMEGIVPEENRSAARAVIESIEGRLEAEKELRELMRAGNLTEEKRASEALELLKAGREAAASLTGSSLSLRKRRDALAEAVSSLEAALEHGDLQSLLVSMRRLRAHLERLPQ